MDILFYVLSGVMLFSAFRVVTCSYLINSALYLASSMLALAGLFFILGAHFIAAVQVLVYAGAVMVLFILVIMLFDLKEIKEQLFSESVEYKVASLLFFTGLVVGVLPNSVYLLQEKFVEKELSSFVQVLAKLLFSEYLFAFECVGVLLLVIAVGVATLCLRKDIRE